VTPPAASLAPRNPTEDAILAGALRALAETPYERLTIDGIAREAYVSRTAVYFYFPNKRAVVDRLIQQAFAEMYAAGAVYLDGDGEPRLQLRLALPRVATAVQRHARILVLAARISGREDRLPAGWQPHLARFVDGAERRIARDQERGVAPADVDARVSARAMCAMVERYLRMQAVGGQDRGGPEVVRSLAELWYRAVYCSPDAPPVADDPPPSPAD